MVLVDSSVWIEVFRKASHVRLEATLDLDEIVTCLPIIQEVLQGFREDRAFRLARESMLSFPVIESPLRVEVFEEAAQLYRRARRGGLTVRSSADCLIAACALRHGLKVLHNDRDFPQLAKISPLLEEAVKHSPP